jgi:hypothetical protein
MMFSNRNPSLAIEITRLVLALPADTSKLHMWSYNNNGNKWARAPLPPPLLNPYGIRSRAPKVVNMR